MKTEIRREESRDHRTVEEITRKAFWNLHVPGCDEHFLAHKLRSHSDFLAELDFVAVRGSTVVGNIMYTRSYLQNDAGKKLGTITFGPVSVHPDFQRQGIGSALISHSIRVAAKMGYSAIIIHGNPSNYCKFSFKGSKAYSIATPERRFPCSLLVKELIPGILLHESWRYFESEAYTFSQDGFEEYDASFEKLEKTYQYTQELYSILSNAYVD
ncbi:MAG: N-acetyltransferase [Desulfopila sp.]|jgi:predicted N-acetyltransferase YhbS|nr:N-acetyltransferase [Desulfopila sp.]